MLAITLMFGEKKEISTFTLLPISKVCPFNEAIFDPRNKSLVVYSKEVKEAPQMLEKLDDDGNVARVRNIKPNTNPYKVERRIFGAYYEYHLTEQADIAAFLEMFVVNPTHPAITALFV
jgi:hypothetical protein